MLWLLLQPLPLLYAYILKSNHYYERKIAVDIYFIIFNIIRTFNALCCNRLDSVKQWKNRIHNVNGPTVRLFIHTYPSITEVRENTTMHHDRGAHESQLRHFYLVYVSISFHTTDRERFWIISVSFYGRATFVVYTETRRNFYGVLCMGLRFILSWSFFSISSR